MSKSGRARQGKPFYREMTVAHIREQKGADDVEVMFFESARIYRLPRAQPRYADMIRLLRGAMSSGRVLIIRLASLESDVIEDVQPPHSDESGVSG
ncbi:MAG TPA: hypothetical protein VF932_12180 [Anaerolineae bacterium]